MLHQVLQYLLHNAMGFVLLVMFVFLLVVGWRAQQDTNNTFNIWDLVMDAGKASPSRVAFITVMLISSWVVVTMALHGTLTEGIFAAWLAAWVAPLTAKVIFGKSEFTFPVLPGPQPKEGEHHEGA